MPTNQAAPSSHQGYALICQQFPRNISIFRTETMETNKVVRTSLVINLQYAESDN